jgi:GxxExxY protein
MLVEEKLTEAVIAACVEVHKHTGAGLLESTYENCLCHELMLRGITFRRQVELPVIYKGVRIDCGYRLDIVIEDVLVLELKSIDRVLPIHEAQLLTYMGLGGYHVGFLINFNVKLLIDGITRRVL